MYTVSHSQWCAILCQSPINNSGKMTVKSRHIQKTLAIPRVYRWTIQVPERRAPKAILLSMTHACCVFITTYTVKCLKLPGGIVMSVSLSQ